MKGQIGPIQFGTKVSLYSTWNNDFIIKALSKTDLEKDSRKAENSLDRKYIFNILIFNS